MEETEATHSKTVQDFLSERSQHVKKINHASKELEKVRLSSTMGHFALNMHNFFFFSLFRLFPSELDLSINSRPFRARLLQQTKKPVQ